jgi:hypothetical protein
VDKGSKALVADGRLTVPLFHGTSTLFYESIVETGLGGRDIVKDLDLRAIVRSLLKICETELDPDPNWLLDKSAVLKIAEEPSGQPFLDGDLGYFNFRYGGTYVSASRQTAVTYARLYNCGSEALSYTLRLLDRLSQQRPALAAREEFTGINLLAQKQRAPLLIEARDVEVSSLRAEQGGSCEAVLKHIESVLNEPDIYYDLIVQQANFELLRAIPIANLQFYKIKALSADKLGEFELESL